MVHKNILKHNMRRKNLRVFVLLSFPCFIILMFSFGVEDMKSSSSVHIQNNEIQNCVAPKIDIFNKDMMAFYEVFDPVSCDDSQDWVTVSSDGSAAIVRRNQTNCTWIDVERIGDFEVNVNENSKQENDAEYKFNLSDHVYVKCTSKDGSNWENIITGLRPLHDKVNYGGDHCEF